jgi:hypothetical protein
MCPQSDAGEEGDNYHVVPDRQRVCRSSVPYDDNECRVQGFPPVSRWWIKARYAKSPGVRGGCSSQGPSGARQCRHPTTFKRCRQSSLLTAGDLCLSSSCLAGQRSFSSILPRPLPLFGSLDKTIILINADGHRIDLPLPPKSAKVADTFNRKTYVGGNRFCNMYHLYGSCSGNCGYLHGTLTERGKCRDPLCFYGHHCACLGLGKKCNFPVAMHGVGVKRWWEVDVRLAA